nr:PREDICTED: sulfide:quinone oxidoreductase, mitochondrial [Bemisia tabaci]
MLLSPLLRSASKHHGAITLLCRGAHSKYNDDNDHCHLLIVGGGTGGCTIAAKAIHHFENNDIYILEPQGTHYYQPLWTLVGGGVYSLADSRRPMSSVIPEGVTWYQEAAEAFNPKENFVKTSKGKKIYYDYMVIATGIETRFDLIPGLVQALEDPTSGVCSNYSSQYVTKTFETIRKFDSGNAVFTFPSTPVKCAGAPQKICYLSESYFSKHGKRDKANVKYFAATPVIFSCKKYADELHKICARRNIEVNLRHNLKEILPNSKEAVFDVLDKPGEVVKVPFSMLHVTPPMTPPAVLKTGPLLTDESGFVNVDKETLQHKHYKNIFALGDSSNLPTSKTAAAVAAQSKILWNNLYACLDGKPVESSYNGYTSCPLVTGYDSLIMAEFDYKLQPMETFPFNQAKERKSMYFLKKNVLPFMYWNGMLKGIWNGPGAFRKLFHPFADLMKNDTAK